MFWKNARKSITRQLALFYSIVSFILFIIVVLSSYWVMTGILHTAEYQLLSDEIDVLEFILKNERHDLRSLHREVKEIPRTLKEPAYRYYIRVIDHTGHVVAQTAHMDTIFQQADFFKNTIPSLAKERKFWFSPQGLHYLLIRDTIRSYPMHEYWIVQAALDISYQDKILNLYRKILFFILMLGTLFSIFLGIFIARRAMGSLRALTTTTKKITATSLHQRIDPKSWPVELHALGSAFNKMLDRIEDSFSRLTQFSGDIAHELRTPINNLIGETEVLLSGTYSIAEYRQVLESNLEELHRISHLIENLLFLSRAENPQLEIKKEYLAVAEEIAVVVEFYRSAAEEKNIQLLAEGNATVYANQVMFRRMLSNILANAIKYTPEKGTILFNTQTLNDGTVAINLKDNGSGISQQHLSKIFNRFYRTDAARAQDSGGVGLGLAIVKSIVKLHQGKISINSKLGQGTEITIVFPPIHQITNL